MVSHHHPTGPFGFCLHFPCRNWRFYWHFFSRSFWLLTAAQLQSQCPCFKGLLCSTPLLGTETFFWLSTAALINHSKTQWLKIRTNINFAHRCAIGAEDGRVAAFLLPRIIWGCWIRIWKTQVQDGSLTYPASWCWPSAESCWGCDLVHVGLPRACSGVFTAERPGASESQETGRGSCSFPEVWNWKLPWGPLQPIHFLLPYRVGRTTQNNNVL